MLNHLRAMKLLENDIQLEVLRRMVEEIAQGHHDVIMDIIKYILTS